MSSIPFQISPTSLNQWDIILSIQVIHAYITFISDFLRILYHQDDTAILNFLPFPAKLNSGWYLRSKSWLKNLHHTTPSQLKFLNFEPVLVDLSATFTGGDSKGLWGEISRIKTRVFLSTKLNLTGELFKNLDWYEITPIMGSMPKNANFWSQTINQDYKSCIACYLNVQAVNSLHGKYAGNKDLLKQFYAKFISHSYIEYFC